MALYYLHVIYIPHSRASKRRTQLPTQLLPLVQVYCDGVCATNPLSVALVQNPRRLAYFEHKGIFSINMWQWEFYIESKKVFLLTNLELLSKILLRRMGSRLISSLCELSTISCALDLVGVVDVLLLFHTLDEIAFLHTFSLLSVPIQTIDMNHVLIDFQAFKNGFTAFEKSSVTRNALGSLPSRSSFSLFMWWSE